MVQLLSGPALYVHSLLRHHNVVAFMVVTRGLSMLVGYWLSGIFGALVGAYAPMLFIAAVGWAAQYLSRER